MEQNRGIFNGLGIWPFFFLLPFLLKSCHFLKIENSSPAVNLCSSCPLGLSARFLCAQADDLTIDTLANNWPIAQWLFVNYLEWSDEWPAVTSYCDCYLFLFISQYLINYDLILEEVNCIQVYFFPCLWMFSYSIHTAIVNYNLILEKVKCRFRFIQDRVRIPHCDILIK